MVQRVDRRRFVQGTGVVLAVGLAGCLGSDVPDGDSSNHNDDHGHDDTESDGKGSDGLVYAFAPNRIAIIDPAEGEVIDEITDGLDEEGWGDPRITADYSEIYVIRESPSQVLVIDTETRELIEEIDIGSAPTHMYYPTDGEMWAHADDEGAFYVIDTSSHDVKEVVQSGLEDEGHGKLFYHEDLGSRGYATNVNDPGVPIIDLENYERSGFIEFDDVDEGTHYKAYSPETGLVYFEFGDETVVVDPRSDETIDRLDFAGGMYLSPDEQVLGVLDGETIRFLDATSEASDELGAVEVADGPDALRYYEANDGTLYAFTAHTHSDEGSIIDVEALEIVETVDIGDIVRPEDAQFLHRSGVVGGGYFITPADDDGIVAIVDMEAQELLDHVEVETGVDTVQFVGDSGVGYSSTLR